MSVSGARSAFDIDLDDLEKRLRAAGGPPGAVEDPLAELARLVEASRPRAPDAPASRVVAAPPSSPPPPPARPAHDPVELRPALEDEADLEDEVVAEAEEADAFEAPEEPPYDPYPLQAPEPPPQAGPPRSSRWVWTVSGLAVAGLAMIGAVFALKGHVPGMAKQPPFIAAAVGPTKVQPPSDATVSSSSDAGATLLRDSRQPGKVNVVSNEEQPVDLGAQRPAATGAAGSAAGGPVVRGTVDTPVVVVTPPAAPAPSSFPEAKPVRTISLRPDGTPIPASAADAGSGQSPPSSAPGQPAKLGARAPSDPVVAQASTPKIDVPTKLPPKSSARVVVGKTDTTGPGGTAEATGEPAAKPEKPGKAKTQTAAAETPAQPAAPAAAETAAASSGGWSVQLAAPRSEAEAKTVASKLGGKYASALGGSALGVHKGTSSGGDTVYRVRVTSLTKADAAALCARIKGDGGECFVTK